MLDVVGTFRYSNGVSGYSGTCTYGNGTSWSARLNATGTAWFSVPVEADGSFTYGYTPSRK
ncbi:MAG: hypothetical protein LUQ35_03720 [Methanoregula sp.]|nr:hypothetical protein [Methanoregula sp.]